MLILHTAYEVFEEFALLCLVRVYMENIINQWISFLIESSFQAVVPVLA